MGGYRGVPTIVLEVMASSNLWHAFFEVVGSNNDINVLDHLPVFNELLEVRAPKVNYEWNQLYFRILFNIWYISGMGNVTPLFRGSR